MPTFETIITNQMTNEQIISQGTLKGTQVGVDLYRVQVDATTYQWWMLSNKTGRHMITAGYEFCERVKAHWDGFQQNQSR